MASKCSSVAICSVINSQIYPQTDNMSIYSGELSVEVY